jgi:signal transduction histidine kinase
MDVKKPEFFAVFGKTINDLILRHHVDLEKKRWRQAAGPITPEEHFETQFRAKGRWVDGTPEYSFHICGLRKLFPEALFIHIFRDVSSVVRSMLHFHPIGRGSLVTSEQEAYSYWLSTVSNCLLAERAYGPRVVFRLRHADLVENPEAALRSVFSFLGEYYEPECLKPLAQRINSSNIPADFKIDLRRIDPSLIDQATRLCQQVEESSQPLEASPAGVEEIEAAFEERVEFVETLVTEYHKALQKIAVLKKKNQRISVRAESLAKEVKGKKAMILNLRAARQNYKWLRSSLSALHETFQRRTRKGERCAAEGDAGFGGASGELQLPYENRYDLADCKTLTDTIPRPAKLNSIVANVRSSAPHRVSRKALIVTCLTVVGIVGYLDYVTGYERSLLLFYLLPISLAVWFGSFVLGLAIIIVSVTVWKLSDLAAGIPAVGLWNAGMAFLAYALFAGILSKLRTLVDELDRRVQDRTAALQREMAERQRLDREIAQVADRERRRLGHDLHDSLGQHLTGTALAAQVLKEKLAAKWAPEVGEAEKLVNYLEEGIDLTRNLARGFFSPELDADGLIVALQGLAENITERFGIDCVFEGEDSLRIHDSAIATQLYRIAQEAVTNSIKHAAAQRITIRLMMRLSELSLTISDDGIGFPEKLPSSEGLGLRLMRHGASLAGASFDVRRNSHRGTIVTCKLNLQDET